MLSAIRRGNKIEGKKCIYRYMHWQLLGEKTISAYSVSAKIHYDAKKTFFVNRESTLMPRK